jgi:hypothetical protein
MKSNIKSFSKFNESREEISMSQFPIWSSKVAHRDGTISQISKNIKINDDEIREQLWDIEDNTDLEYKFEQNFEIKSIDQIIYKFKIQFNFSGEKSRTIDSYIKYYQKASDYFVEIKNISSRISKFFGFEESHFRVVHNCPIDQCGYIKIFLEFTKEIKSDEIKSKYLEYLDKSKNIDRNSVIFDPNVAVESIIRYMEENGVSIPSDYVSWTSSIYGYEIYICLGGQEEYKVTLEDLDENGDKIILIDWDHVDSLIDSIKDEQQEFLD